MATVNVVLKKNKKYTDGKQPLYIRITKGNSSKYISLGFRLNPKDWLKDKQKVRKGVENSARINNFIAQKAADAQDIAMKLEIEKNNTRPNSIKNNIIGGDRLSFTKFAEEKAAELKKQEKINYCKSIEYTIYKLKEFTGSDQVQFSTINSKFLIDLQKFCVVEQGLKQNTFSSIARMIKKLFNDAEREGYVNYADYPFKNFRIKSEKTEIEFLTDEELFVLIEYKNTLEGKNRDLLNLYIFACYAAGIRFSDLCTMRWKDFDGTHLLFKAKKTNKQSTIKLPNKALEIIEEYKDENLDNNTFIFPHLRGYEESNKDTLHLKKTVANTTTNRYLHQVASDLEINKNIHFHTSRHTFATRALRKGMRIEYVSKLLGHASIKTTQIYAKVVNSELDKAMDILND
jgi:integrase